MRREFPGEVRLQKRDDGEAPVIAGHAAMFTDWYDIGRPGTPWHFRERIVPGAFKDVINGEPEDTAGLYNHNADQLLGRYSAGTLRLSEDDTGLAYEIDADLEDEIGRRVVRKIDRGELKGNSFAFEIGKQEWTTIEDEDGEETVQRTIHSIASLWDVGPVVYPANPATDVALRELREAGFDVPDIPDGRPKPVMLPWPISSTVVLDEPTADGKWQTAARKRAAQLRARLIRGNMR